MPRLTLAATTVLWIFLLLSPTALSQERDWDGDGLVGKDDPDPYVSNALDQIDWSFSIPEITWKLREEKAERTSEITAVDERMIQSRHLSLARRTSRGFSSTTSSTWRSSLTMWAVESSGVSVGGSFGYANFSVSSSQMTSANSQWSRHSKEDRLMTRGLQRRVTVLLKHTRRLLDPRIEFTVRFRNQTDHDLVCNELQVPVGPVGRGSVHATPVSGSARRSFVIPAGANGVEVRFSAPIDRTNIYGYLQRLSSLTELDLRLERGAGKILSGKDELLHTRKMRLQLVRRRCIPVEVVAPSGERLSWMVAREIKGKDGSPRRLHAAEALAAINAYVRRRAGQDTIETFRLENGILAAALGYHQVLSFVEWQILVNQKDEPRDYDEKLDQLPIDSLVLAGNWRQPNFRERRWQRLDRLADPERAPWAQMLSSVHHLHVDGDSAGSIRNLGKVKSASSSLAPYAEFLIGLSWWGDSKRADRAIPKLELADRQGVPAASYLLAQAYFDGVGVARDRHRALTYLRVAAKTGFAPALLHLGRELLFAADRRAQTEGFEACWAAASQGLADSWDYLRWAMENKREIVGGELDRPEDWQGSSDALANFLHKQADRTLDDRPGSRIAAEREFRVRFWLPWATATRDRLLRHKEVARSLRRFLKAYGMTGFHPARFLEKYSTEARRFLNDGWKWKRLKEGGGFHSVRIEKIWIDKRCEKLCDADDDGSAHLSIHTRLEGSAEVQTLYRMKSFGKRKADESNHRFEYWFGDAGAVYLTIPLVRTGRTVIRISEHDYTGEDRAELWLRGPMSLFDHPGQARKIMPIKCDDHKMEHVWMEFRFEDAWRHVLARNPTP